MLDTIIVAIISMAGSVMGAWFAHRKSTALIAYQLQELKVQVEKHNKVVERMAIVERDLTTAFGKIDEIRNNIEHLHPRA